MFSTLVTPERSLIAPYGNAYAASGVSGTVAALLAIDSLLFSIACGAQANVAADAQQSVCIDRLRIAFTTIAAFTTPVIAARRIGLYRASGGPPTGGTALAVVKKNSGAGNVPDVPASIVSDLRIAAAAALTANGTVREAAPIATMDLTHVGAAGARAEFVFELNTLGGQPLIANPGELIVVSNPVAMDAGGTFQLSVDELHWFEAVVGRKQAQEI